MEKNLKIIKEEAEALLSKVGIKSDVNVEESGEGFTATLDAGDDNALLIGKHGNTLSSFELILTLIVSNKIGEFKRITVEVGSYRAEREQYLESLADKLKDEVITSGYEKQEVTTESIGEDRDRTLIIKRK
jgi:spoIIIJ-associated protein